MPALRELLKAFVDKGASDLHLTVGLPPMVRLYGRLLPLPYPPLTPEETREIAEGLMTERQRLEFERRKEVDFSFGVEGLARFRVNVYRQRGSVGIALRLIPYRIMTFEELGLPKVVEELCERPKGLILVTGPTGSGKSTTLAAMIDRINREREEHIITIEDPIEYLHSHKRCIVTQREVGTDTDSFHTALRSVLREDPDKVLIGEMRDLETIKTALVIAETGHLTFTTLHTNSAVETINRIIDVFPPYEQPQIRAQLAFVLEGVLSQRLLPRADGRGRVLALEILIPTPAIRNLIRESKVHQIYSAMQAGQERSGMQTMNQSLFHLYQSRLITLETALGASPFPEELKEMIQRAPEIPSLQRRR